MASQPLNLNAAGANVNSDFNRVRELLDTPLTVKTLEQRVVELLLQFLDGRYDRNDLLQLLTMLLGNKVDRDDLIDLIAALLDNRDNNSDLVLLLAALILSAAQIDGVARQDLNLTPEFRELLAKLD